MDTSSPLTFVNVRREGRRVPGSARYRNAAPGRTDRSKLYGFGRLLTNVWLPPVTVAEPTAPLDASWLRRTAARWPASAVPCGCTLPISPVTDRNTSTSRGER